MSWLAPGPIHCPSCNARVARHPWFVARRIRELTCPHCGALLEVSIPAWSHYLTALLFALLSQVAAFALLALIFFREWWWVGLGIAVFAIIDWIRSAWLRSRATVRWINQGSMERRAKGAWIPE
jgi:hypothetical protein